MLDIVFLHVYLHGFASRDAPLLLLYAAALLSVGVGVGAWGLRICTVIL